MNILNLARSYRHMASLGISVLRDLEEEERCLYHVRRHAVLPLPVPVLQLRDDAAGVDAQQGAVRTSNSNDQATLQQKTVEVVEVWSDRITEP